MIEKDFWIIHLQSKYLICLNSFHDHKKKLSTNIKNRVSNKFTFFWEIIRAAWWMFFKHNATASWERLWKIVLSTHLYKRDKHINVRLTGGYHIPWRSAAEVHPPKKKIVTL